MKNENEQHNHMDQEHMDHEHMNHEHMNHEHMNHEHMNHEHMNHEQMGHEHHGMNFKKTFMISLFFGVPILILSPMMGVNLPFQFSFTGSETVVAVLATILFFYGGKPFIQGAYAEWKKKIPGMMMLITLGISVAYGYSLYAYMMNMFFNRSGHIMDFFWELASLILIMLLGHWIEMEAVTNAGNALEKMAALLPNTATVIDEHHNHHEIPLTEVQINQLVLVKGGEKIPVDGHILEGQTYVNESLITGEAKAVAKTIGDKVIGGSVNGNGTITVKVTGTGESGYLAQVMNLVSKAARDKSKSESLADVVAKWLFYVALVVGVTAFIVWTILENYSVGIERAVAVFVIACPHALGLAIPLVTARSTSIGAKNGLLVKSRQALEVARKVDVVMMDKTGTLTEGNFAVVDYRSFHPDYSQEEVLVYLASLEQGSSHPLAIGILEEASRHALSLKTATDVKTVPGSGVEGIIDGHHVQITNVAHLKRQGMLYDESVYNTLAQKGYSISFLIIDDALVGLIAQGDELKPQAKPFIKTLKQQGILPVMLTGDNQQAAMMIAQQLGIDTVCAELMPEDKESIVQAYKAQGKIVLMVGDGVNDAPSLVRADVGIAIGAGTDIAVESADVILVKSDPSDIVHFISLAKNTSRKMKQNLLWGAGYNIIAIPLAAGLFVSLGFTLSPAVGAIIMSLSTIIVAINAMLLRIDQ